MRVGTLHGLKYPTTPCWCVQPPRMIPVALVRGRAAGSLPSLGYPGGGCGRGFFPLPHEMMGGVGYMKSPISRLMGPGSGEEKNGLGVAPRAETIRVDDSPPIACSACAFLF